MKILCPVRECGDIEILAENGADEFFFGFLNPWMVTVSRAHLFWNRRSATAENVKDSRDVWLPILRAAGKRNIPIYATANELFYSEEQAIILRERLRGMAGEGLGGVIVSDLPMMAWCAENLRGLKIIAGTTAHVLNSGAVKFFEGIGSSRVILPIWTRPDEAEAMKRSNPGMEFECFAIREECVNINGLCLYCHLREVSPNEKSPCRFQEDGPEIISEDRTIKRKVARNLRAWEGRYTFGGCTACTVSKMSEAGVEYLKIAGRGANIETRLNDLRFFKALISGGAGRNHAGFIEFARGLHNEYLGPCPPACMPPGAKAK